MSSEKVTAKENTLLGQTAFTILRFKLTILAVFLQKKRRSTSIWWTGFLLPDDSGSIFILLLSVVENTFVLRVGTVA